MSSRATQTRPESGLRNPMIWCSDTDLPTPLRPRMQMVSPGRTLKLTLSRTRLSPNALLTLRKSMYGPICASATILSSALACPPLRNCLLGAHWLQILRCIQVLKHLCQKTLLTQFFLPNRAHFHLPEQRIDLVLAFPQRRTCHLGKVAAIRSAQWLPAAVHLRKRHRGAARDGLAGQVAQKLRLHKRHIH